VQERQSKLNEDNYAFQFYAEKNCRLDKQGKQNKKKKEKAKKMEIKAKEQKEKEKEKERL